MRRLASTLLLVVAVVIGLGAFGHSFMGRLHVDAELAKFPVDPNVYTMLYVVWYFLGGCMALFALAILWASFRLRSGERSPLFITALIGFLYFAVGVGGFIYRHGDPFQLLFVTLGALLLLATFIWSRSSGAPPPPHTPRRTSTAA
jgi:hypothetical protein